MIKIFQKFEKNGNIIKKIATTRMIKNLITIPLSLATMPKLIIKHWCRAKLKCFNIFKKTWKTASLKLLKLVIFKKLHCY